MIIGSSAIVAMLRREPGVDGLLAHLAAHGPAAVGTPTLVETGMVIDGRHGSAASGAVQRLVAAFGIEVVAFHAEHWVAAHGAFQRYGKGRHPAALDFGDCLTYAVAKVAGRPLLCVGEDFVRTDLDVLRP